MRRFKNILVIYSQAVGEETALARATAVAKRNGSRLTVTTVLKDLDADVNAVEEWRQHLERLCASLRHDGLRAEAKVLVGTPFLEITREVLREGHDLVMMAAEGPLGPKKILFGSTSKHLMRKCPCPVWVTRGQPTPYAKILAAVDPDEPTEEKVQLNGTILELAASLARLEQSELHVVHAWEPAGKDLDAIRSEVTQDMRPEVMRRVEAPRKKQLEELVAEYDLGSLPHEIHLLQGEPAIAISELAEKKNIDLIVMGTVCRTGVPGFLIGNTAETLLQMVDCSVLTVKPPGFVSPVLDEAGTPIPSK
jgi:nucleotide-binding universal stress UspA family protein